MWESNVSALVRRHKFDFEAAAREVGATAASVREALSRHEFRDHESLFEVQEKAEKKHEAARNAIFDRVLQSLGGPTEVADCALAETWRAQRQRADDHLVEIAARRAEQEELRELSAQREALRRRFDAGSADAIGEDPLLKQEEEEPVSSLHLATTGLDDVLDKLDDPDVQVSAELQSLFKFLDAAAREPVPKVYPSPKIAPPAPKLAPPPPPPEDPDSSDSDSEWRLQRRHVKSR